METSKLSNSLRQEVKIRPALETDISKILKIQEECALSAWSETDYAQEINNTDAIFAVAEDSRNIINGFILARFIDEYTELDLLNIGVAAKFRKQGIGNLLLQEIIDRAVGRQTRAIWLEVRESNFEATDLYGKNGFVIVQRRKDFYTCPNENALIMSLDLKVSGKT